MVQIKVEVVLKVFFEEVVLLQVEQDRVDLEEV
jgi:hypothetical protein